MVIGMVIVNFGVKCIIFISIEYYVVGYIVEVLEKLYGVEVVWFCFDLKGNFDLY